jgi:hypothetical protein
MDDVDKLVCILLSETDKSKKTLCVKVLQKIEKDKGKLIFYLNDGMFY